jgi:DNA-binding MarR family transcriptional regulator
MMQSARWYMDVAEQIFSGMGARTNPTLERFLEEIGGLEGLDITFVQVGYGYAPEPITADTFLRRGPYGNGQAVAQALEDAVERGWLEVVGEGQYTVTAKGVEVAKALFAHADKTFDELETLPNADLKRIAALLSKVVEKAQALPEPAEKWALAWTPKFDRGTFAPLMVQVRRRMLDLLYFRDDAHLAAWAPYNVSGKSWEAFTYVWRGDASTAADLMEKLPSRNYDEEAYANALEELAGLGWIAQKDDKYVATGEGKKLRQEAEDATDRYFDAAWTALSQDEIEEVKGLLQRLATAVKPQEEEES